MHIDPQVDAAEHLAREAEGLAYAERKYEWAIAIQAEVGYIDGQMVKLLWRVKELCNSLENAPPCESADDDTARTCREAAYAAMGAIFDHLVEMERFAKVAMRQLEVYEL